MLCLYLSTPFNTRLRTFTVPSQFECARWNCLHLLAEEVPSSYREVDNRQSDGALNGSVPLIWLSLASREASPTSSHDVAEHRTGDLNAFDRRSKNGVL